MEKSQEQGSVRRSLVAGCTPALVEDLGGAYHGIEGLLGKQPPGMCLPPAYCYQLSVEIGALPRKMGSLQIEGAGSTALGYYIHPVFNGVFLFPYQKQVTGGQAFPILVRECAVG